jgi:Fe2+ transport system protein B
MTKAGYLVALAGNPNTGKSTVFNALTGLRQHTGNWPGKTVTRAEGSYEHEGAMFHLIDLPGTYSLLSTSVDEEVARDFILFGQPDVTVVVADSTSLERNLNLILQVLQITARAVVCSNLFDEARRRHILIDKKELEAQLGVPVVFTAARSGEGLDTLRATIAAVARGSITTKPRRLAYPKRIQSAIDELVPIIRGLLPELPNAEWVALRILDGDEGIRRALENGRLAEAYNSVREVQRKFHRELEEVTA